MFVQKLSNVQSAARSREMSSAISNDIIWPTKYILIQNHWKQDGPWPVFPVIGITMLKIWWSYLEKEDLYTGKTASLYLEPPHSLLRKHISMYHQHCTCWWPRHKVICKRGDDVVRALHMYGMWCVGICAWQVNFSTDMDNSFER